MTITEFLLARIEEDEEAVSATYRGPSRQTGFEDADPARVLAECRAKRAIVEVRQAIDAEIRTVALADHERACDMRATRIGLDVAIKALVLPYSDHPDFREEWRA